MNSLTKNSARFAWTAASLLALAALAFAPASARADFQFTGSASSSDGPVSAEAYFTLQNDQITLYVANLTSGLQGQGQAISGITFTTTAPAASSLSLTTVAGRVVNLAHGTFTPETPAYQTFNASSGVAASWAVQSNNNVTDLGNPSNPHYMIVGPNASFQGNGGTNFNPYFQSTATAATDLSAAPQGSSVVFVLSAPNVTSASTIDNVVFTFGTSPNEHTANGSGGFTHPTPEPATMTMLGIAIASLTGYGWRRRKQAVNA